MYTFGDTIKMFLSTQSKDTAKEYKPKIESFYQFLTDDRLINNSTYCNYLSSMKINDILEALDYFIKQNKVSKETVARYYCSVVKNYFLFLNTIEIPNNKIIELFGLDTDDAKSYMYLTNKAISRDKRLSKPDKKTPYELSEIELLISECDTSIELILAMNTKDLIENKFDKLVALLCIKLMIFTGAKPNVIYDIKINERNIEENKLDIKSFVLHTPNNLAKQLKKYVVIRNNVINNSSNLFITHHGETLDRSTYIINNYTKGIIGRGDTWGIVKYTVVQMIKKGINQSIIIQLTGIGNDIYNFCQNLVNEEKKITANKYLDSNLIKLHLFDRL